MCIDSDQFSSMDSSVNEEFFAALDELELPSSTCPPSQDVEDTPTHNIGEGPSHTILNAVQDDDVSSSSPPVKKARTGDREQAPSHTDREDCISSWNRRYSHIVLDSQEVNFIDSEVFPSVSNVDHIVVVPSVSDVNVHSTDIPSVEMDTDNDDLWSLTEIDFETLAKECEEQNGGGVRKDVETALYIDNHDVNGDNYSVTTKEGRMNKKFNVRELIHVIKLHPRYTDLRWGDNLDVLVQAIQDVINRTRAELSDDDRVSVHLNQRGMQTPLILDLTEVSNFTVRSILDLIEKMLQSNESLKFDISFEIHVTIVKIVRGAGRKKIVDIATELTGKKSVVVIPNNDNMCAARAIVVGRAHLEESKSVYITVRKRVQGKQKLLAEDLCDMAGVDKSKPASLNDIKSFETVIDRKIVVISADILNKVAYAGSPQITCARPIFLYHHHNHFDLITNPCGFYGHGYFCYSCLVPYYALDEHRYGSKCDRCYRENCPKGKRIFCRECNRDFSNQECFKLHKTPKTDIISGKKLEPICKKVWKCTKCDVTLKRKDRSPDKHRCSEKFCFACQVYYEEEHRCYIKKKLSPDPRKKFIFFDFETVQETGEHVPNYCVAHRCCEGCIGLLNIDSACSFCRQRQFIFQGPETNQQFCKWLFSEENRGSVALAHNLKGFDGVFVLKYLIENGVKPDVIYNGGKIMSIEVGSRDIRLIDSLNHIPMALANLPKAFQLQSACKGFFPYLFNTPENQNYVGPVPPVECYDPDSMSPDTRENFLKWYSEQSNVEFDFQAEMKRYAISDVDILRKACLTFRKLIMRISSIQTKDKGVRSVDPFNCITLASLCFDIYRHIFLQHGTIAKVPAEGITGDQFSRVSIVWLEWLMYEANGQLHIAHALNGREKRVGPYRADGFDESNNTVYFFDGDFWHGNPSVYCPDTVNEKVGKTMGELHRKTLERKAYFERNGYKYVAIWEKDFRKQIEEDAELKCFADKIDVQDRLDPRDAFYGGRCNASKLFYEIKQGERILYYDFCSLYPSVNKYGVYPKGYPEVITKGFQPLENYTGFVKAKVLPPRGLYHPVLPYRCRGKLMFPLCKTCCENDISACDHNDEERSLIGTWVTVELMKAVEKGYVVIKVYEVLHFKETMQYDGKRSRSGLFTPYIDAFLKIKQEASGWPEWVHTEADKKKYVQMYRSNEGISLDASKIEKNPGLRSVAKLCLNSLWGKFSQRPQMRKNAFVTDMSEFYGLLFSDKKRVVDVHIVSDDILLVDWVERRNFITPPASSNVYIGAFTTCQARLKLYDVLDALGERVLYYDTDSCIFVSRPGEYDPPTGDYLGELTDELPGDYIQTFVSGGPKNYAYRTMKGKEVCKVRGFTLNYRNSAILNFDSVERMVLNTSMAICTCRREKRHCKVCRPYVTVANERKICRDRVSMTVYNRKETKDYRVCYDKRLILDDYDTLPYGY